MFSYLILNHIQDQTSATVLKEYLDDYGVPYLLRCFLDMWEFFSKKNDQKEGLAYGDYVKEHPRERNSIQSGGGSDKYILHLGRG